MERPRDVSTLSAVLTLLGVSALGGLTLAPWGQPLRVAHQLLRADPRVAGWVILVAATIYCAAALTAAIALRRMRPWAVTAYICFVCSIGLYCVVFLWLVRIPVSPFVGVGFFAVLVAVLYWGWTIVKTTFRPSDQTL